MKKKFDLGEKTAAKFPSYILLNENHLSEGILKKMLGEGIQ
jgi:hypothetical protein